MRKFYLEDNVTEQDLRDNGFTVHTGGLLEFAYIDGDNDEDTLYIPLTRGTLPSDKVEVRQIIWDNRYRQDKVDKMVYKLVNSRLFKIVSHLNYKQIEYIRDNHEEVLDEVIDENISSDLIYTDDVWDILIENYSPFDVLNGKVTMDDLLNGLYGKHWDDEDTYKEVYDRLDEEQQEEIDNLED